MDKTVHSPFVTTATGNNSNRSHNTSISLGLTSSNFAAIHKHASTSSCRSERATQTLPKNLPS
jgi:hypothetical protein